MKEDKDRLSKEISSCEEDGHSLNYIQAMKENLLLMYWGWKAGKKHNVLIEMKGQNHLRKEGGSKS